jgi:hypothetical protein
VAGAAQDGGGDAPGNASSTSGRRTHCHLRAALAADAIHYGLDEIDAATIRLSAPRAFTQRVSRFVYEQRDDLGSFSGIRYRSRLGDEIVNWAVFEPAPDAVSPFVATGSATIEPDDPDLLAALAVLVVTLV